MIPFQSLPVHHRLRKLDLGHIFFDGHRPTCHLAVPLRLAQWALRLDATARLQTSPLQYCITTCQYVQYCIYLYNMGQYNSTPMLCPAATGPVGIQAGCHASANHSFAILYNIVKNLTIWANTTTHQCCAFYCLQYMSTIQLTVHDWMMSCLQHMI
jgi:hypothetical protein